MYKEYKQLDLSKTGKEILDYWKQNQVFDKSISNRPATKPYIFYEGTDQRMECREYIFM